MVRDAKEIEQGTDGNRGRLLLTGSPFIFDLGGRSIDTDAPGGIASLRLDPEKPLKMVHAVKKSGGKRAKKQNERPVFDVIRKPVAPPGHTLGQAKPEERIHPSMRKAKHKRRAVEDSNE